MLKSLTEFAPVFPDITEAKASPQALLLGQQRAQRAFTSTLTAFPRQHLFGVTFPGLNRKLLLDQLLMQINDTESQVCIWFSAVVKDQFHLPACCAPLPITQAKRLEQLLTFKDTRHFQAKLKELCQQRLLDDSHPLIAWLQQHQSFYSHWEVRAITQPNSEDSQQSPIIEYLDEVNESALFGEVLSFSSDSAALQLQFKMGAWQRAQGGILVIDAAQLSQQPKLQRRLYSILLNNQFSWRYRTELTAPQPEICALPSNVSVVLLGGRYALEELQYADGMFSQLFSVITEFDDRVSIATGVHHYAGYLQQLAQLSGTLPLTTDAIQAILPYSSRLCEHNDYLSLASRELQHVLSAANTIAQQRQNATIDRQDWHHAMQEQWDRTRMLAERSYRDFAEGTMLMATSGTAVAQVNGMSVVDIGHVTFGEPTRITAVVHYGDGDVIDIERKAELAGNIHAKGTMILSSYLASLFGQNNPLHLSASLVFEQSYSEVDGDSASLAELIALLSALAQLPVRQDTAITGAIDQFGHALAIGGVNEKIEGFFDVASLLDDGTHHVIIPTANARQLNLRPEVIAACRNGKLVIHTIDHVSEAIAFLMAKPAGELDEASGRYTADSVFNTVQQRFEQASRDDDEPRCPKGWRRWFTWSGQ